MLEAIQSNPAAAVIWQEMKALAGRQDRFRELIQVTPLFAVPSPLLSGYELVVKNEGAQNGDAYKLRGAYNRLLVAQESGEPLTGVTAASTGNHLRGVAIAANHLELPEVVGFCPEDTVEEKIAAVEAMGVRVKLTPDLKQGTETAGMYARSNGMLFVHPFDHPSVIAGNGTAALEAMAQLDELGVDVQDPRTEVTVMLPGGGGGIASGSVVGLAAMYPSVRSVVVQRHGGDNIVRAMHNKQPLTADEFVADCRGAAVIEPGDLALRVLTDERFRVQGMSVTPGEIGRAMRRLSRLVQTPESAGALAMAGAMRFAEKHPVDPRDGKRRVLVTIMSGANPGADELAEFAAAAETERLAQLGAAREAFDALSQLSLERHALPETPQGRQPEAVRRFRAPLNVISRPHV